jgi:hypothetical protein
VIFAWAVEVVVGGWPVKPFYEQSLVTGQISLFLFPSVQVRRGASSDNSSTNRALAVTGYLIL